MSSCFLTSVTFAEAQNNATHPPGIIAGRVVDDDGRPIRGANVQAMVRAYIDGRRQMLPRGNTATTNDRGEFRLFWLEPNSYYIAIIPNPMPDASPVVTLRWRPPVEYVPADPEASFVTTFFPGTADSRDAEAVQVGPGEVDVHAIQVAALPTRVIRGRIISDGSPGEGPQELSRMSGPVLVTVRPLNDMSNAPAYSTTLRWPVGNGEFQLRTGLAPGQYRLVVGIPIGNRMSAGSATMTVENTDPDVVEIPLSRTVSVDGQIEMEGALPDARSFSVLCIPTLPETSGVLVSSTVRANGKFLLENIVPERYTIRLAGLANDDYLATAKLQGKEVSPVDVVFPSTIESVKLTLLVKHDGGSVRGVVVDERRTARAEAVVVLAPPPDLRTRLDLFKSATTNNQGEFHIRGVAPGNYSVVALSQMIGGGYNDPAFLSNVEAQGVPVTVGTGDELNLGTIATTHVEP